MCGTLSHAERLPPRSLAAAVDAFEMAAGLHSGDHLLLPAANAAEAAVVVGTCEADAGGKITYLARSAQLVGFGLNCL